MVPAMSKPIRILQVEDAESDAAIIVRLFEKAGYVVHSERVQDAEEMRHALTSQDWNVVISDYHLPQFNAALALSVLQEYPRDVPFIVVSGEIGEERAVEMMRAGAKDYVLKDRIVRLVPAVQRELGEAQSRRERLLVEDSLRGSDECLALIAGVTHLGIFYFFPQTSLFTLSEGGRRHIGLPVGRTVSYEIFVDCIHPDDRDRVVALIARALNPESGGEYTADYRTIGIIDRTERCLEARGKVFFDGEGGAVRFVGVTIDVSKRKELEEQFRQAQKLEVVGRLAGGVAHDFNNMLQAITGYSEMTRDNLPPLDPSHDYIEEVLKAAARATSLTRQLLLFSRRQPTKTQVIVLNELVENVKKMLERLIGADVSLVLSLDPSAGTILADTGQIEQVIMNLIVNARDAMPNGGTLSMKTARYVVDEHYAERHLDLVAGQYASLSVGDTGTGISPEVKARMFDPFFTTKEPGKGTGLGLSTVYGIIKQFGGAISVDSDLGRGSTFTVLLPAAGVQVGEVAVPAPLSMLSGSETILLAEDDNAVRSFVRLNLEQHGYQVLACSNGREAIERARQHPGAIDLLLTDAVMPEMGGGELVAQFAASHPDVPVLFMSAYLDQVWPGPVAGGNHLSKPFSPAMLLNRVREVLDHLQAHPTQPDRTLAQSSHS